MKKFSLSYREVIPDQTVPETWKEITLNTGEFRKKYKIPVYFVVIFAGGTQSTLQDIKISEKANGYCYRDALKHYTRNRFIYW